MSTKYKATTTEECYFITITTVGWVVGLPEQFRFDFLNDEPNEYGILNPNPK